MAGAPAFKMSIVGDIRSATKSLDKMEKRTKKFGGAMKKMAGAMVAAFAVGKIVDGITSSIARAEEMNSLYAATETIVANMGGAVGKTADEIKELNKQLSLATGVDKAKITEGSNVLLTFGNIGEEAFERASAAMLDMSAVFGGDAKQAATQLGKALNDPIQGMSALARVGVAFTDEQKEQIRVLQESGDMMGAQAIILAEIEGQVGGVAVATADATAKLGNMGKEAQEWVGNKILPIVEKLADFMIEKVVPAFQKVADWIKKNVPPWYKKHIEPTMKNIQKIAQKVLGWLSDFWKKHGDKIIKEVGILVGLVIGYYQGVWNVIKTVLGPVISWLADMWKEHGDKIIAALKAWWDVMSLVLGYVYDAVKDAVRLVTAIFKGDWAKAWEIAQGMGEKFGDFMRELPRKIWGYVKSLASLAQGVISAAWSAVWSAAKEKAEEFRTFMQELPGKVLGYVSGLATDMRAKAYEVGKKLKDGIVSGVGGIATSVKSAAKNAAKAVVNAFIDMWNRLDPKITMPTMTLFGKHYGGQSTGDLLPDIPRLASGGIVYGPTLAIIGEKTPEAVVPLNGSGIGDTYNITIEVGVGDPVAIGRELEGVLARYTQVA